MDIRRQLARNLKRLRLEKGWSQEELADQAGLHRTYVSGVERGVRNPTITIVAALAKALGVSPAELLSARSSG
jgi:transcriptional regulator with XRE-family HTH domain